MALALAHLPSQGLVCAAAAALPRLLQISQAFMSTGGANASTVTQPCTGSDGASKLINKAATGAGAPEPPKAEAKGSSCGSDLKFHHEEPKTTAIAHRYADLMKPSPTALCRLTGLCSRTKTSIVHTNFMCPSCLLAAASTAKPSPGSPHAGATMFPAVRVDQSIQLYSTFSFPPHNSDDRAGPSASATTAAAAAPHLPAADDVAANPTQTHIPLVHHLAARAQGRMKGIGRKILFRTINRRVIRQIARRATIGLPLVGFFFVSRLIYKDYQRMHGEFAAGNSTVGRLFSVALACDAVDWVSQAILLTGLMHANFGLGLEWGSQLVALADRGTIAMAVLSFTVGVTGEYLTVLREEREAEAKAAHAAEHKEPQMQQEQQGGAGGVTGDAVHMGPGMLADKKAA